MKTTSGLFNENDYNRFVELVYDQLGIRLGADKQSLVESRLANRLRHHNRENLGSYLDLLAGNHGEMVHLFDAITTNTTSFYREFAAFQAVDELVRKSLEKKARKFRFWSAASSMGMEAYTLAIMLAENGALDHDCAILCTDISTRAIAATKAGIYKTQAIEPVPGPLRNKYFTPTKDGEWQIDERLRNVMTVNRLNLSRPPFPMQGPFDAIFCRNVMIYFDIPIRQKLISACYELLRPGGYLLIGAAESLHGIKHNFTTVRPAVYRR
jgi:chemotaxis protein methyltransferase CheR